MMYDIVIVGAGIIGTLMARELSRYRLKTALIDKESDVANETSMANSAIVHTGYDPEDGTLKALLNVRGAEMYPQLCRELGCRIKQTGAYIAACGEEEEAHLEILADRAERRGIEYAWLSNEEAHIQEPNLSDHVTRVLDFPTTCVIYPWEVAIAAAETAVKNGTELYLNHACTGIDRTETGYVVHTKDRDLETKMIINCAGIFADELYAMVGTPDFEIKPRKGEYYVLDNTVHFVKHIVFPVPSAKGKGVLAVPTVYGNTLIGPNSDFSDPEITTTAEGLAYVRENITKTLENIPLNMSIRTFAGLRPSGSRGDFIIEEAKDAPGFINIAGIESPGLASAPAIVEYAIENLIRPKTALEINEDAVMTRERPVVMSELSEEERTEMIRRDPRYANIVCRCEQISEGEVVDCINRPCGARTVKGVKKRVRPGMGRCQGGFCEPKVLAILSRELGIPMTEVVLDAPDSRILIRENR